MIDIIKPKSSIRIKDIFYEDVEKSYNSNHIATKKLFKLYQFEFGTGDIPRFLMTNAHRSIPLGTNELSLAKLHHEHIPSLNKPIIFSMAKMLGIGLKEKDVADLLSDISQLHEDDGIFYELDSDIEDEYIETLRLMNNKQLLDLVYDFISGGYEVDKNMLYLFSSHIIMFDTEKLPYKYIMPFQPHMVVFTNHKVGKSSIAQRISPNGWYESARISRLLGFSTAENVAYGDLNGKEHSVFLDEVQEETQEGLFRQLLSYEENGISRIAKGKETIITAGCAPVVYQGNPRSAQEEESGAMLYQSFFDTIKKVTDNWAAFGSRKAIIVFGNEFKEAGGRGLPMNKEMELSAIINFLFDSIKSRVTDVFIDDKVQEWIRQGFPQDYLKLLNDVQGKCFDSQMKDMIRGLKSSHKHARGLCFRQAILGNLSEFLNDNVNIDDFIADMDNHFEIYMQISIKSLNNIVKITSEEIMKFHHSLIANMKPKILKTLVLMCGLYDFDKIDKSYRFIVLSELKNLDKIDKIGTFDNTLYSYINDFSKFEDRFDSLKRHNKALEMMLGMTLTEVEGVKSIMIVDRERFNILNMTIQNLVETPLFVENVEIAPESSDKIEQKPQDLCYRCSSAAVTFVEDGITHNKLPICQSCIDYP